MDQQKIIYLSNTLNKLTFVNSTSKNTKNVNEKKNEMITR